MTDDIVRTKILINENNNKYLIDFHDFWINRRGNATVVDIFYENSNYAGAPSKTIECIKNSDIIIIGPSNPITSIAPILSIKDIKDTIIESNKPVVAVSPIIGEGAVSGPAGILMKAKGYPVSAEGVCKFYNDLGININTMILDNIDKNKDFELKVNSCDSNTAVAYTNTIMKTIEDKINLAKFIVNLRTI